ncbi:MAG: excinuclease ABC subunit UvrC [Kiritimatiellae bacterium]|nr:excinuclease ABC subunit UvrC [Kiritimatiellia bacterium]
MQGNEHLRAKLEALPDAPGVYLFRDAAGTVIYIGKARSLRRRVRSYFSVAARRRGDPKLRSLVHSIGDLEVLPLRTEAEAAVMESRLIKEHRPRYNIAFRDDKRFLLLRVDPREPWPRFTLARIRRDDGALWFGPYPSAAVARATLDFLGKQFGLRQCRPRLPGPEDHRHCHADIIRHCSAPCVGRITAEAYRERLEQACRFLRGEDPERRRLIADAMRQAAASLDFERAAALRDLARALDRAVRERALARRTPELHAAVARAGMAELAARLGLATIPRVMECFDVSNIGGDVAVGSLVRAEDGLPQRSRYRRFRIRTVDGADDPAMIGEVVRRRLERARGEDEGWSAPDLIVVDGGIPQVRAAKAAARDAGFGAMPVIGLAKRFEHVIHGPDGSEGIVEIPRESPALTVLQALRDEAHRFALAYHRRLRARRLSESKLDEIEGIGPKRKRALLVKFGSVARLARAPLAEIAAVPGIGTKLAAEILAGLRPAGAATTDPPAPPR